jgi:hypothetical protein
VKPEEKKPFHPFVDKLSPYEEWKHTLITVMETVIQFMLHDIFWNACYYTWHTIFYVLVLLPFAVIGLIGEYLRKIKNRCLRCKKKKEPSPFREFSQPPKSSTKTHKDTPALSFESDDNSPLTLTTKIEKSRREVPNLRSGYQSTMSPPRFETKGDFIIIVDLDHTLVYSQLVSGTDTRTHGLNDSFVTV